MSQNVADLFLRSLKLDRKRIGLVVGCGSYRQANHDAGPFIERPRGQDQHRMHILQFDPIKHGGESMVTQRIGAEAI
jgi:hypothetical protein